MPLNYQYELSSWIYKRMAAADTAYTNFLHQQGYGQGHRRFKLFCFSPLELRPFRIHKELGVFELQGQEIQLQLGFMADQAAEAFIKGVFMNQHLGLGNRVSQVDMEVVRVEGLPEPPFKEVMQYKAMSPIVISQQQVGQRYAQYLDPTHDQYADALLNNLVHKWASYQAVLNTAPAGPEVEEDTKLKFKLLTEAPRSKLITIKALTPEETKVKGYLYDFSVYAPLELQRLMYSGGVGEKGSMGFGWIEKIHKGHVSEIRKFI